MKTIHFAAGLLLLSTCFGSCIKQSYDNPPDSSQYDPALPVNLSIGQLSNMAISMGAGTFRTMGDSTIYGIVTADDRSGNFYKEIVIQDSTGGMTISIAQTNLYNNYPIGRKVYVKLNGLTLINYKGLPEVGLSATTVNGVATLTGLPTSLVNTYVIKGSFPNTVTPMKIRIIDVFSNPNMYLNRLVTFENMEFVASSANQPYAAPSALSIATTRTIQDCPTTGSIPMYNSGFATFQPSIIPNGKGTITGIFSIYTTAQFLIRDTFDVQLNAPRDCP